MAKFHGELLPNADRRLATWISLANRRLAVEPSKTRPTVTISRRFGCEAFQLAERLSQLLHESTGESWQIFDKALLERVSQEEHLSLELLENLGGPSRAADLLRFVFSDHVTHDDAFRFLARHVVLVAHAGNAIIIGRGGAIITANLPNCYHFRLDASDAFCVASTIGRLQVTEKEAEKMLREYDKQRERFFEERLHATIGDIAHYHAVFNRDRAGIEEIASAIAHFLARACEKASVAAPASVPHSSARWAPLAPKG